MRLNHDCVRELLLELEEKLEVNDAVFLHQLEAYKCVEKYGIDDVIYSILKLKEADYINASVQYASNKIYHLGISSITWEGHQFLDTIRDNKVWNKTKEITSNLSSVSLSLLSNTASSVLNSFIQGLLP